MVKVENLSYGYGSNKVLSNISVSFEEGKIYGLLGENGVGKTTLLTLLCGLKKPQDGTITIDGKCPFDRLPSLLGQIQYLPEDVMPIEVTPIKYAEFYGKFWPDFKMDLFNELLTLFEIDPLKKMNEMSTGQLKKSYISYALACSTKYIFMDEPTNGLDIPSKAQFRKAITKYTSDDSIIVISTHQVRDLESIIDPIIILDRNDVILNASVEEVEDKLYFDYSNQIDPDALYSEQLPGGFVQVTLNSASAPSKINVEALFNAAHQHKELMKNLFR